MISNVSDLDLRLIRNFLAVVEAKGVTAAQVRLNVSQPAISSQLTTLETRLGFRLCDRGRGGFKLTGRGQRFAESAYRLLDAMDSFSLEARSLDKQLVGNLTICTIGHAEAAQNAKLSEAISRFLARDQAVRISVVVRPPGEIEEQILSGAIDVAIGYFWHRASMLDYVPLFVERQSAYCGRGHPLFNKENVELDALGGHRWIYRSYPVPEANYVSAENDRFSPLADNMEAAAVLIMSGQYLGYLPEHFAQPYAQKGLLWAPSAEFLKHEVTFHLVSRKARARNEVVQSFVEDTRSVYLGE